MHVYFHKKPRRHHTFEEQNYLKIISISFHKFKIIRISFRKFKVFLFRFNIKGTEQRGQKIKGDKAEYDKCF